MKLISEEHDQMVILKIQGEVTEEHAEDLFNDVQGRLAGQVRDFVFDLSETEFIDSVGLETLLTIQENATEKLGQVRLAALGENVNEILRITRLASRIERHATVDDAIKSLRI